MRREPRYPRGLTAGQTITLDCAFDGFRWSPDGRRIASVHNRAGISILRVADGATEAVLREPGYPAEQTTFRHVAWSPDGAQVAAVQSQGRTIKLFHAGDASLRATAHGHDGEITCLDWMPDGTRLVTGARDGFLALWDAGRGETVATAEGPGADPLAVATRPNGSAIATQWDDGLLRLWDRDLNAVQTTAEAGRRSLAWHPTKPLLAAGRKDGGIALLDAADGSARLLQAPHDTVDCLSFSADGMFLAGGRVGHRRGGFCLWRTDTWTAVARYDMDYERETGYTRDGELAFDPSGPGLAYLAWYGELRIVGLDTAALLADDAAPATVEPVPAVVVAEPMAGEGPRRGDRVAVAPAPAPPPAQEDPAAGPGFDVFLCYNSADRPAVREVALRLKAMGLSPWLDEWQLRPGLPWQPELERQIEHIRAAAVFVGRNGIGPWQNQELEAFIREFVSRRCPVIPVLLADCPEQPRLPAFLSGMTWVDLRLPRPDPIRQLVWGITGEAPE